MTAIESPSNGTLAMMSVVHKEVVGNGKQRPVHPSDELRRVESKYERVDEVIEVL